jgi:hypothetical protein
VLEVKAIETPVTSVAGVFYFLQTQKNRPEVSQGAVSVLAKPLPCGRGFLLVGDQKQKDTHFVCHFV